MLHRLAEVGFGHIQSWRRCYTCIRKKRDATFFDDTAVFAYGPTGAKANECHPAVSVKDRSTSASNRDVSPTDFNRKSFSRFLFGNSATFGAVPSTPASQQCSARSPLPHAPTSRLAMSVVRGGPEGLFR